MKILIIGHGRHGKDTVAEELVKIIPELSFVSSSLFVAEKAVRPDLANIGIEYPTLEACYEDRHNHREFWRDSIADYCQPKDRMCREIFQAHDIYVGMRKYDEFVAARPMMDLVVYVDASKRLEYRDPTFEIPMSEADTVIDNNRSMQLMRREVRYLGNYVRGQLMKERSNG